VSTPSNTEALSFENFMAKVQRRGDWGNTDEASKYVILIIDLTTNTRTPLRERMFKKK